ncbi:flagellar basal body rod protein FlgC [Undibacterium sp. TJN25]|uniref:flagellar basal body rod protein FlgC n=1 Tax=Undibacterium sp. TJN25 TaxID=3413056 RepID=UPI003BF34FC8
MDYNASFHISATGMVVEKARLDVTAANLANVHSTAPAGGQLYRPMRVVSRESPMTFSDQYGQAEMVTNGGTQLAGIEPMDVAPKMVYEPGHPDADDKGFVSYPGIDNTSEMMNMMSALRAYEANVVAMNAARTMASHTLDIGGQS